MNDVAKYSFQVYNILKKNVIQMVPFGSYAALQYSSERR